MKQEIETTKDLIQLFPESDKGDEWKNKEHKWCIMILDKKIAEGLKLYLQEMNSKRMVVIKDFEEFKDSAGTLMNKISATQIDHSTLYMDHIKYPDGEEVHFIWTGMKEKEVNKYFQKFKEKCIKLREENENSSNQNSERSVQS